MTTGNAGWRNMKRGWMRYGGSIAIGARPFTGERAALDSRRGRLIGPSHRFTESSSLSDFDSSAEATSLFGRLGVALPRGDLESRSPIDGAVIGAVPSASAAEVAAAVARAHEA